MPSLPSEAQDSNYGTCMAIELRYYRARTDGLLGLCDMTRSILQRKNGDRFPECLNQLHASFRKKIIIRPLDQTDTNAFSMPSRQSSIQTPHNVGATDVMCGRGTRVFKHPGNQAFRQVVFAHLEAYMNSPRVEKTVIIRTIASHMYSKGSRFLKKNRVSGEWYDAGEREAKDKIAHMFRDAAGDKVKYVRQLVKKKASKTPTPDVNPSLAHLLGRRLLETRSRHQTPNPVPSKDREASSGIALPHQLEAGEHVALPCSSLDDAESDLDCGFALTAFDNEADRFLVDDLLLDDDVFFAEEFETSSKNSKICSLSENEGDTLFHRLLDSLEAEALKIPEADRPVSLTLVETFEL